MKHIIKLPAVFLGLLLLVTGLTQNAMAQDGDDISLETFYEELAPYGRWAQDPDYGYVWQPDVDRNFRPYYTDGHWTMTEYGNTWVSDYEWGWAPFHYGRWIINRFDQWVWIPDTEWGPAWVSWRSGDGYYGWAPLSPEYNSFGSGFDAPLSWWAFIPQINIYSNSYPAYYNRGQAFYNRTAFINYTYRGGGRPFYIGPRIDDIRRVTRRDVTVYRVNTVSRPGRYSITNNNINIYRPRVTGGRGSSNLTPANSGRGGYTPATGQNNQPSRGNWNRGNNSNSVQPSGNAPGRSNSGRGGRGNTVSPSQPGSPAPASTIPEAYTPTRGTDQGQRPNRGRRDGIDRPQQMQLDDQQRQQRDAQRQQMRDAQRSQQDQQQRAQRDQQRMQMQQQRDAQRQQQDQQRQQQMQQQRDAQRQQQDQQRQQMQQQRDAQRAQQDQQRQQQMQQQRDAQRAQQDQQRQQMQQQRQQQDQQRQQQQQQQQQQQSRGGRGGRN